jgi:oxidase EvaA
VLVDTLQSEQGGWFLCKRNRNMVVEVPPDLPVPVGPDHLWLTLDQLGRLLRRPNLLNMPARSVLAGLSSLDEPQPDCQVPHTTAELLSWLNTAKLERGLQTEAIPLDEVTGWHRTADEIGDDAGLDFRLIGVAVTSRNREVPAWCQPMLAPRGLGLAAFVIRRAGGVRQVLVRASVEPGLFDRVELGPTVQCHPHRERPALLDHVLGTSVRVVFDAVQSEEGGRFHHALTRYLIVEAGDDLPPVDADTHRWMTPAQLLTFQKFGGLVNVQARTLIAGLHLPTDEEFDPCESW